MVFRIPDRGFPVLFRHRGARNLLLRAPRNRGGNMFEGADSNSIPDVREDGDPPRRGEPFHPFEFLESGFGPGVESGLRHLFREEASRSDAAPFASLAFWDTARSLPRCLDWNHSRSIRLIYVDRGALRIGCDGKGFSLAAGQVGLTSGSHRVRLGSPSIAPSRVYLLTIDWDRAGESGKFPDWLTLSSMDGGALARVLESPRLRILRAGSEIPIFFARAGRLMGMRDDDGIQPRLKMLINEILLSLLDKISGVGRPENPAVHAVQSRVRKFLAELPHSLDKPWELNTMAYACGLGRTRFSYMCLKIANRTPLEYLTWCRMELAKELLLTLPEASVSEVAGRCGIPSGSYFGYLFRKCTGKSPSAFRNSPLLPLADRHLVPQTGDR